MRAAIIAACCIFAVLGLALIPYAGIETDEAAFTNPLHQPVDKDYRMRVFHHDIQLMLVSYAGTLKTLICWPVLRIFRPSAYSMRVPAILFGVVTIFLFYRLAESLAGARAALWAALLLASDPTFLLSDTFDWGPVALEHLLLVAGMLMIARGRLSLGFFFFGLALWNKATFAWAFCGLIAGVAVAYWPEVRRSVANWRAMAGPACAFLAGAAPFLIYNLHYRNVTMSSNAHFSLENFSEKRKELISAANGSGLFLYIASEEWADYPKAPVSLHGRAAVWIREIFGEHKKSLFAYAIVLAILAMPLWWRSPGRRSALFAIVFSAITFLAMAVTRGAGAAIHHTVLLWPMPHLLVGAALAALRPRWLVPLLGFVLIASNLLVINQYFAQLERDGAYGNFTDALYPLSASLSDSAGDTIYVLDWGMGDSLSFLHWGKLDLQGADGPFQTAMPDAEQRREMEAMFSDPHALFLGHVRSAEMFHGVGEHLDAAARASGYQRQFTRTIQDSNGRPVFELFRVQPAR